MGCCWSGSSPWGVGNCTCNTGNRLPNFTQLLTTMKKNFIIFFFLVLFLIPVQTFASVGCTPAFGTPQNVCEFFLIFVDLIRSAIPLVMSLALLAFFWGLAKFILQAGDEKGREDGKQVMKWGIVALFVLVSVYGILTFLTSDFGLVGGNVIPQLP